MSSSLPIIKLGIENEMDVMLAHRRAMQFAKYSGIMLAEQTRFATAVSEICRNVLEYAKKGEINFSILKGNGDSCLQAIITDKGQGILELNEILKRQPETHRGRGLGIVYARRLADVFQVDTTSKGTQVLIQKNIPSKNDLYSKIIIDGWLRHIRQEPAISAYEELKIRNSQLVELTEELRANGQTVQKQMLEIKQLNLQLSENNERMKEFTYAISHDLKNPLSSLKIAVQQLSNQQLSNESSLYQGVITRSVNRLDKTIHSLIEILDIQNQDNRVIRELEFDNLFQDIRDEYKTLISETKAVIKINFTEAPRISYVEGYIVSLFHNMLSNSLKYRHPYKKPVISISSRQAQGGIELSFQDNGIGMDIKKIGTKLFTPFSRFTNQVEGKGIGLYLVKGMVESNGGNVAVESEVDKGTIFRFRLIPYRQSV